MKVSTQQNSGRLTGEETQGEKNEACDTLCYNGEIKKKCGSDKGGGSLHNDGSASW